MARPTPESFEKRQRERRKQLKRADKLERRLLRNEEKRRAKAEGDDYQPAEDGLDEDGLDGEARAEDPPAPLPRNDAQDDR